jgi:hypothetical protein
MEVNGVGTMVNPKTPENRPPVAASSQGLIGICQSATLRNGAASGC